MRKPLRDFSIFEGYRNRQVVLNYYEDEDLLWKRDGFDFDTIQYSTGELIFSKNNFQVKIISLNEYHHFFVNEDFQNYYTFRNDQGQLDIYFPL